MLLLTTLETLTLFNAHMLNIHAKSAQFINLSSEDL